MEITTNRRQLAALVGILVLLLGFVGYAQYDIANKRAQLRELAMQYADEFFTGLERSEFEYLIQVESGKLMTFFGDDWGVVRLAMRQTGDEKMETFSAIEYFHEFDGGWRRTDTAQMREPLEIFACYGAFEDHGYTVHEDAYLRFQRR